MSYRRTALSDELGRVWQKLVAVFQKFLERAEEIMTPRQENNTFFPEFKTEASNVRLRTRGKNICYNVQYQIYVTPLTDTLKLRHNKMTVDR